MNSVMLQGSQSIPVHHLVDWQAIMSLGTHDLLL